MSMRQKQEVGVTVGSLAAELVHRGWVEGHSSTRAYTLCVRPYLSQHVRMYAPGAGGLLCPTAAPSGAVAVLLFVAGEFGRGSAMQYGEADLQGRDFEKQVGGR
jgi:hypothetical protein